MKITLEIEVREMAFNPSANPDTAKLRWIATDRTAGAIGRGETVAQALAACLSDLAEKV